MEREGKRTLNPDSKVSHQESRKCEAAPQLPEGEAGTHLTGFLETGFSKEHFGHDLLTIGSPPHCLTQPKLGSKAHSHCMPPPHLWLLAIFHLLMEKHIVP